MTSKTVAAQTWAKSVVTWFEIPVRDFERARKFYEKTFAVALREEQMGSSRMGVFPHAEDVPEDCAVSGCIIAMEGYEPSTNGSVVYVNTRVDLQRALDRARAAGGETLVAKSALPDGMGYFAQIRDSEGNRVGLYSTV
jgi:uncharacterized protein